MVGLNNLKVKRILTNDWDKKLPYPFFSAVNGGGIEFEDGFYLLDKFGSFFNGDFKIKWEEVDDSIIGNEFDFSENAILKDVENKTIKLKSKDGSEFVLPIFLKNGFKGVKKLYLVLLKDGGIIFQLDLSDVV